MKHLALFVIVGFCFAFISCSSIKNYSPTKKYAAADLQKDFTLMRNALEAKHPSLYWYTPKEKIDAYFTKYYKVIQDSMTEQQFAWLAVAPMLNKIHCGHTSMMLSKKYYKWGKNKVSPSFPYYVKIIGDSLVVYGNLNAKKDSSIKKGDVIISINEIPNKVMIAYMLEHLSEDGFAHNVNYIKLSGNFPYYHRSIFGLSKKYNITYLDSAGIEKKSIVPFFSMQNDSLKKDSIAVPSIVKEKRVKISKKERLKFSRILEIDSSKKYATLTINTFSGGHLRRFFRKSFKQLKSDNIKNLIIDIRSNGGGRVGSSTLLTKYISKQPFKVADTVYAKSRGVGGYAKHLSSGFFNTFLMIFMSSKRADGKYHLKRFENHTYLPKKNNYNGKVFVLTGGNTFSASVLFCNAVIGQPHIKLVGEETGGGAYGNTGMTIPTFTLPNTKVRFRLPLFRVVQPFKGQIKGQGILPDILIPPSYDALIKGYDKKMVEVKKMIFLER